MSKELTKTASYNELTEEGMKITQAAFVDELEKIAGKGALFAKAVKAVKNIAKGGSKAAKKGAKAIDKGVRSVGAAVGKGARKASKGKFGPADLRKKKTKRLLGLGAIGAGAVAAKGTAKAIKD
jgi:hypothetical protein